MIMIFTIHPGLEGFTLHITATTITTHGSVICIFIPTIHFIGELAFILVDTGVDLDIITTIHLIITGVTAHIITEHTTPAIMTVTGADLTIMITDTTIITDTVLHVLQCHETVL